MYLGQSSCPNKSGMLRCYYRPLGACPVYSGLLNCSLSLQMITFLEEWCLGQSGTVTWAAWRYFRTVFQFLYLTLQLDFLQLFLPSFFGFSGFQCYIWTLPRDHSVHWLLLLPRRWTAPYSVGREQEISPCHACRGELRWDMARQNVWNGSKWSRSQMRFDCIGVWAQPIGGGG